MGFFKVNQIKTPLGNGSETVSNQSYTNMLAAYGVTEARPGGLNITKYILEKNPIPSKSTVLEIGCGLGDTANYLSKEFQANVTAVDPHLKMIEKGKKRHSTTNITWILGDVNTIKLPINNYDFVISESVLSFTPIQRTLKTIYQHLITGGKLLLLEPIYLGGLSKEEFADYKRFYGFQEILTEDKWKEYLEAENFEIEQVWKSYDINNDNEMLYFPELVMDKDLDYKHIETLKKHEELTEKYFAFFDYVSMVVKKH